jgi:serine/threonine protein kinase
MLLGSAFYMSPEQIRSGRDVDARSDLWSLGVILFRALTGSRPFPGAAPEALAHILHDEPPAVRSLNPSLPVGLESFFKKALDKEVLRRFQTIDDMLDAFAAALRGESLSDRASDGSSVLAAIERLGISTAPPPMRPRQSTAPTARDQPTVVTSTSISLEELLPTEASGTRVREELPSTTAVVSDTPERRSIPSPWSTRLIDGPLRATRGAVAPRARRRLGWPLALLVVALVATGIILSKDVILAWASAFGILR